MSAKNSKKKTKANPKAKSKPVKSRSPSVFVEVSLEKRVNEKSKKTRYNKFESAEERKEYFSQHMRDRSANTASTKSAKSKDKGKWSVTNYDMKNGDTSKKDSMEDYSKYKIKDIFKDFPEIDVKKLVQGGVKHDSSGTCGVGGKVVRGRKRRSRKTSPKKYSKKKSSKKKSSKKKSKPRKKSRKKRSRKKRSRKK